MLEIAGSSIKRAVAMDAVFVAIVTGAGRHVAVLLGWYNSNTVMVVFGNIL